MTNNVTLLAALFFAAFSACAADAPKPFTDITRECGVEEAVEAHYKAVPKWWLSGIDLVDLDGDGHLDLFIGAHGQAGAIALNDGLGHFNYYADSAALKLTEIHLAHDLNEDGKLDLQITHQDGGGIWLLNETKPGDPLTLAFKSTGISASGGQARENALIDINRDGKIDWLHENPGVVFALGDGSGGFKSSSGFDGYKETSMLPIDLNGDGQIDFVLKCCGYHSEKEGKSRIMLNDGHGNFRDATTECGLVEDGLTIQGVGDFNQDGFPDLICLSGGKKVEVYLNDGHAKFTLLPNAVSGMENASHPVYANWGLAVMTDFDNDGIPDVIMNGRCFLYVLRGTGGGHFTYMNKAWGIRDLSYAAVDEGICFGDIDGDGALDIIGNSGSENHKSIAVYHNDLPKQHWLNIRPIGLPGNRAAAGAKIRLFEPSTKKLLCYEQVVIAGRQSAHTYYAYATTERHFGLGKLDAADVSVEFYPSGKIVEKKGVKADATLEVQE
ncbi:MAG TPA: CRTAC1 family protein [Planctomycetota bacterium]|nr:CRTAC1 family protein [Planctomycetota bacterium]